VPTEPARLTQLDTVLSTSLGFIETALDAYILTITGMPHIKSYGTGDPTWVNDDQYPTVRASGTMFPEAKIAGRTIEPHYKLDYIVAFKARDTDEAYYDGVRLADLILQIMLANDVYPPYWRYINRSSVTVAPAASQDGKWQGGLFSCQAIGDQVSWL
jgi:hypothetical protein